MHRSSILLTAVFGLLYNFSATKGYGAGRLACPSPTDAPGLTTWRQTLATGLQNRTLDESSVASTIAQCYGPTPPACLNRLKDYARRGDVASSDADPVLQDTPEKQPPAEFYAPGGDGTQFILPPDIERQAAQRGWLTVRYKTRHSGGFDEDTTSLLMVFVPGDKVNPPVAYDRWLNFALPSDRGSNKLNPVPQANPPSDFDYASEWLRGNLPKIFTMVTVKRSREELTPATVYFQSFRRQGRGARTYQAEANSDLSACYTCHPNGLRAISPLGYHVRAGEWQLPAQARLTTQRINQAMDNASGHKVVSWRQVETSYGMQSLVKPEAMGPVLGPVTPLNSDSRSQAFILGGTGPSGAQYLGCYKDRSTVEVRERFERSQPLYYQLSTRPRIRWEKIVSAMRCASCHNGKQRGTLNQQINAGELDFKILVDQSMPLGAHRDPVARAGQSPMPEADDLSADERIALANCLRAEFNLELGHLATWLTQTSCQE